MSMLQMGTIVVILAVALILVRMRAPQRLRAWLPGALGDIAYLIERLPGGLSFRKAELQDHTVVYLDSADFHSKKPAIVLLHGFAGEKDDWNKVARHLTRKFRVVVPDLPGAGESTRQTHAHYDFVAQARRVRTFAQKIDLDKFHIAGCSTGGAIAGIYAAVFPDDVLSLTLIESFGIDSAGKGEVEKLSERGWSPLTAASEKEYERAQGFLYNRRPRRSMFIRQRLLTQALKHRAFNQKVWKELNSDRPYLLHEVLSQIKVPTLIIWGDSNKVVHQTALKPLELALPKATSITLKGCGHMMILERPKEIGAHMLAFLTKPIATTAPKRESAPRPARRSVAAGTAGVAPGEAVEAPVEGE